MNKNVIVAFSIAICIFAIFAIYGLVNQDYLKLIDKGKPGKTETTTIKTSQECTKKDGNKTYKYTFYLNENIIEKLNVSYENSNDETEYELLKSYLTQSFGGITNKHLLGKVDKYVFTFDINDFNDSLNEVDIIKQLNINVYNTNVISDYIVKLDESGFTC